MLLLFDHWIAMQLLFDCLYCNAIVIVLQFYCYWIAMLLLFDHLDCNANVIGFQCYG